MIENDLDILSKKDRIAWVISMVLCAGLIIFDLLVRPRMIYVVCITIPVCIYALVVGWKLWKIYKESI